MEGWSDRVISDRVTPVSVGKRPTFNVQRSTFNRQKRRMVVPGIVLVLVLVLEWSQRANQSRHNITPSLPHSITRSLITPNPTTPTRAFVLSGDTEINTPR